MKPLNTPQTESPPQAEPYDSTLTYRFSEIQEHVIARALRLLIDSGEQMTKFEREAINDLDRFWERS